MRSLHPHTVARLHGFVKRYSDDPDAPALMDALAKLKGKTPKSRPKAPWVTRKVRKAVYARSGTRCENPACTWTSPPTVDHFYGKANAPETVETCWVLCLRCHREKTDSKPNRKTWLLRYRGHCVHYGYLAQLPELDKAIAGLEDEEKQRAQAEAIRDAYNRGDLPG